MAYINGKEVMFSAAVNVTKIEGEDTTYEEPIRNAIIGRGGTVAADASYKDFPSAIYNIPADNAITTVYHNDATDQIEVLPNATSYAFLAEFGGVTRRDAEGNMLYNEALDFLDSFSPNAAYEKVAYFEIPPEIKALEGYGDGININYYNKVDIVNKKYRRCIETYVLNGSEEWAFGTSLGATNNYFGTAIGEHGIYAENAIVCSHYERKSIASGNTNVGITVADRSMLGGKCCICVRPENVASFTAIYQFKEFLAANPITVKVARLIPIERALPVEINPIIKVAAGGVIEINGTEYGNAPIKMIFQTITQ